jgi:mono/diheme cytochrome c family protein
LRLKLDLSGEPKMPVAPSARRRTLLLTLAALALWVIPARAQVTFNKDIAPILHKNCAACHRPGEVAPFALLTYDDAKKRAKQLVKVTHQRYMPPWKAEPGYGDFVDPRRLTDAQIALIKKWADEGAVEGKASDRPATPVFTSDWQLGKPDQVIEMSEEFEVPAEGKDIYRCFVIPINNAEDKYVTAVEYRPGNREVVHHALLFLDNTGQARKRDARDAKPGYSSGGGPGFVPAGALGGWAPGLTPRHYPEGVAAVIQKGSDLVLQTHFHPTGKVEKEKSSLALYFAKKATTKVLVGTGLTSINIDIPAGEKAFKATATVTLPVDTEFISVTPHAHLLCKQIKADYTLPTGLKKPLIWIKDWDFDWQDQYQFKTPLRLPKGTKIDMEYTFDNSAENVRNPSSPPKRVKLGEQTNDEMAILFMNAAVKSPADGKRLAEAMFGQSIANNIQDKIDEINKLPPDEREKAIREAMDRFKKRRPPQ